MNLDNKSAALDRINRVYEDYVTGLDLACRKNCCHCCTTHVTMTTLEAYQIFRHLQELRVDEPIRDLERRKRVALRLRALDLGLSGKA